MEEKELIALKHLSEICKAEINKVNNSFTWEKKLLFVDIARIQEFNSEYLEHTILVKNKIDWDGANRTINLINNIQDSAYSFQNNLTCKAASQWLNLKIKFI